MGGEEKKEVMESTEGHMVLPEESKVKTFEEVDKSGENKDSGTKHLLLRWL